MRRSPLLFVLVSLGAAACHSLHAPARQPYAPNPGPEVSPACLAAARAHVLTRDVPENVGAYRISRVGERGLYLRRTGRALTDDEGRATFDGLRSPAGVAGGRSALSSSHACADAPPASCLAFELWLCQTSLERLTTELDAALAHAGAADGELAVLLDVLEARGPKCGAAASCPPGPHYSTKDASYDANGPRRPIGNGAGRCERDGDCEGPGNDCFAWYLQGGAEQLLYRRYPQPTFCGCVERTCTWFDQD